MSNESALNTYVLALEDEYSPSYSTLHTFTDPEIWNWLNETVTFPEGESIKNVLIPGTEDRTWITIGSYANDKAQALTNTGDSREDSIHPNLTEFDFDGDYDATLERLTETFGAENVFSGLWY